MTCGGPCQPGRDSVDPTEHRPQCANGPRPQEGRVGAIDLDGPEIEASWKVVGRIRAGLQCLSPDRLLAVAVGMKQLPRVISFGWRNSLAASAGIVRKEPSQLGSASCRFA